MKRSKALMLTLMGGVISGCDDGPRVIVFNDLEDCMRSDRVSSAECKASYQEALSRYYDEFGDNELDIDIYYGNNSYSSGSTTTSRQTIKPPPKKVATSTQTTYKKEKSRTVSRGGFGSKSSARGSWGG